jgi:hypothetical protein
MTNALSAHTPSSDTVKELRRHLDGGTQIERMLKCKSLSPESKEKLIELLNSHDRVLVRSIISNADSFADIGTHLGRIMAENLTAGNGVWADPMVSVEAAESLGRLYRRQPARAAEDGVAAAIEEAFKSQRITPQKYRACMNAIELGHDPIVPRTTY